MGKRGTELEEAVGKTSDPTPSEELRNRIIEIQSEEALEMLERLPADYMGGYFRVKQRQVQIGRGPLWSYRGDVPFAESINYEAYCLDLWGPGEYRIEPYRPDHTRNKALPTFSFPVGDLSKSKGTYPFKKPDSDPTLPAPVLTETDPRLDDIEDMMTDFRDMQKSGSETFSHVIKGLTAALPFLSTVLVAWMDRPKKESLNEALMKSALAKQNSSTDSGFEKERVGAFLEMMDTHYEKMFKKLREQAFDFGKDPEDSDDKAGLGRMAAEFIQTIMGGPGVPLAPGLAGGPGVTGTPGGEATGTLPFTPSEDVSARNRCIDMMLDYFSGAFPNIDEEFVVDFWESMLPEEDRNLLRTAIMTDSFAERAKAFNFFFSSHPRSSEMQTILVENREKLTSLIVAFVGGDDAENSGSRANGSRPNGAQEDLADSELDPEEIAARNERLKKGKKGNKEKKGKKGASS